MAGSSAAGVGISWWYSDQASKKDEEYKRKLSSEREEDKKAAKKAEEESKMFQWISIMMGIVSIVISIVLVYFMIRR